MSKQIESSYRFDEIVHKSFLGDNQELSTETINRKSVQESLHLRVPGSKIYALNFIFSNSLFYPWGSLNMERLASFERTE